MSVNAGRDQLPVPSTQYFVLRPSLPSFPFVQILAIAALALCFCASRTLAAEPRVELDLATEIGFDATQARPWLELLGNVGFAAVRLRTALPGDEPSITASGTGAAKSYRVIGLLAPNNQLTLPNGRFTLADRARIEQWLSRLRDDGEEGITTKPSAFGLLPNQLVEIHQALAVPVKSSTLGKQPREVAKTIAAGISFQFVSDPAVQAALAVDEPVADELQGVSSGTALAAVLRPLGLVFAPERFRGQTRLRIASGRDLKGHWPVGWKPSGNPRETLPDLFKFLNVEVVQTPVGEAVAAIGSRLKAPVLIDRNSLARNEIDLATKVDFTKPNTFYGAALDQLLFQAKLKYELRVDEANKPLLWITTIRQP